MENNQEVKLNSSAWILSYVDFMTVIMAFFIVFVMIITKVDDVTELFIVKNITSLENSLKNSSISKDLIIENAGYNGLRVIIPSEVGGISMFNSGSQEIRKEFKPFLSSLGTILLDSTKFISAYEKNKNKFKNAFKNPKDLKITIRIEGHTDSDGYEKSNMQLSLRRAEDVKNYFLDNYITANGNKFKENQFAICGYGESRPLNDILNKDENRRVEVFFNYIMDEIPVFYGCTNKKAYNYNPRANRDDGTCILID
ncbi:MAG: OmpA family protein [Candidatus Neomarinimicrobiota bacterium]|nr:OmpA family protein [Candidatus Neomarinimicrobiota bacterium]